MNLNATLKKHLSIFKTAVFYCTLTEKIRFTYYLDSLLRTALKIALGFKSPIGEEDALETAIPMKDYTKVLFKQGAEEKLNTASSFAEIEAYAGEATAKASQDVIDSMDCDSFPQIGSVDIALNY